MSRHPPIANPARYTPVEWAERCLTAWRGRAVPLRDVLARLAEGCEEGPSVFFALLATLEPLPTVNRAWPGGSLFACDDEAVVAYLPTIGPGGPATASLAPAWTEAEAWFRRHHRLGPLTLVDLRQWDRRVEDLPAGTPAPVRRGLGALADLYLRVHEEASAAPAVIAAGRRLAEATHHAQQAKGTELEAALRALAQARTKWNRLYLAASGLARRRLLELSTARVARL
jgi:hypothetical protein